MADFIEGKRPVIEALRTGVPIKSILMADNVQRDGLIEDILRKAKRARCWTASPTAAATRALWRRPRRFRTWASAT